MSNDLVPAADGPDPSSPQWRALAMRRLRVERGWTVAQVGQKVGLHASQVSRAENGLKRPMTVPVICGVFEVTEAEALRPCPNCKYRPPAGYTCQRCGTEARHA
jgi:transcriptional regulator with XRE-family HTH domain